MSDHHRKLVGYVFALATNGEIDELISRGFEPHGSPVFKDDVLYQAWVKYAPEPEPPDINTRLLVVLADALNILVAEADHHERLIEALDHAQRRGYVTVELRELEMQHEADRESVVMRAKQEGWVK